MGYVHPCSIINSVSLRKATLFSVKAISSSSITNPVHCVAQWPRKRLCVGLCRAITDPGANNGCGWRVFRITWSPPWRRGMRGQPTTQGDSTNNHYNYRWWVFFSVGLVILAAIWWDNTGFLDLWWSSKHTVSEWISATGSATRWLGQRSWMTWLVDDPVVIYWIFTLWLCQNSYWKWWFIVSFPIKNGDFP